MSQRRRRFGIAALTGLLATTLAFMAPAGIASAGTSTIDNACFTGATATYGLVPFTFSGTAAPNPATLGGGQVTLSNTSFQATFSAALFLAGYRLFLLNAGANNINATVSVAINGSNTSEGTFNTSFATSVVVTIIDPTPGSRSSGDESAEPLVVNEALPNSTWTPTGGNIQFTQGAVQIDAVAGSLPITLGPCAPTSGLTGCDGTGANCTGFTPTTAPAFDTVTVNAPPTAPVCTNETVSVGAGQTVPINLNDNCTDVNGNINPATFTVSALTPNAGTLTSTATPGVYSYTAPGTDPGVPVTFTFTVADTGGLVSNTATASISVLANQCDATTAQCSLTEILVLPVIGTTMTFDKAPGNVIMSTVTLNGQPQVSTGSLQDVTITNARGSAAGWSVTGFATDIGAPGGPTITLPTGQVVPNCSAALGGSANRLCIPGDNLGWAPSAAVSHPQIAGDVASVTAGPASAASATAWLDALKAAGLAGVNGIGGLLEQNALCSAPTNQSGGTFTCDAALWLGVPASAGATNAGTPYSGGIVLTLA